MLLYIPYYDQDRWSVQEVDTEKRIAGISLFKLIKHPGYSGIIVYGGVCYDADCCFNSYENALKWIKKDLSCTKGQVDIVSVLKNNE